MVKKKYKIKKQKDHFSFGDIVCYVVCYLMFSITFIFSVKEMIDFVDFRDGATKIDSYVSYCEEYTDDDNDRHYNVYVSFEYEGEIYKNMLVSTIDSKKEVEDKINIYYNPKYPDRVENVVGEMPMSIYGIFISVALGIVLTNVISSEAKRYKKIRNKVYR